MTRSYLHNAVSAKINCKEQNFFNSIFSISYGNFFKDFHVVGIIISFTG
jgi:hypothetical protein